VVADVTVTYIARKRGLHTADAGHHCGRLCFADLGVPAIVVQQTPAAGELLDLDLLRAALPRRHANSHKGLHGHLLLVGGDHGMGGAIVLAATAAARCGVGLISVATRGEHLAALLARQPELMATPVDCAQDLRQLLDDPGRDYSALVLGPGLGRSAWSEQMAQVALARGLPTVVDADALNLLAGSEAPAPAREDWVLTPHPGEAGKLLGCATSRVQQDRFAAIDALRARYGGTLVLKGAGTLVADPAGLGICTSGNPGMASGGMGDVLAGVIGALLAQHLPAGTAARLGVCLHAAAGDRAALASGPIGLLATDLIDQVRALLNEPRGS
jgi:NAD(P)H-hydrate epimerase